MKSETLGISWLNGRLDVAWTDRFGQAHSWTAPQPIHDSGSLNLALTTACRQQGLTARRANFVLDHRNLMFHVQETPPAKGQFLDQLIERATTENRFFEEPAACTRLALPAQSHRQRWLLAITPKSLLAEIESACTSNRLELAGLFPAATLLSSFLPAPGGTPEPTGVLLVADLGASHGLLAGRTDGQILFARSIAPSVDPSPARLQQEINRTLHFCQQQFGTTINQVVALGSYCHAVLAGQSPREGIQLDPLSTNLVAADFARLAADLTAKAPFNFLAASRRNHQAARLRMAVAAGLVAVFGASIAFAATTALGTQIRQERLAEARRLAAARSSAASARLAQQREGRQLLALIQTIPSREDPAIAALFARYLQTTIPHQARLTSVDLSKSTNGWSVSVEGVTTEQGSRFLELVENFEAQLRDGVFQLKILESTPGRLRNGTPLASSPAPSTHLATKGEEQNFFITGLIQ